MTLRAFRHRIALALTLGLLSGMPLTALATPYTPPPGLGLPGPREGAGTRGCLFGDPAQLVALMPENNVGWTTAAHPRFYWFLPLNTASYAEFVLRYVDADTQEEFEVYRTRFAPIGEAGIVTLGIPEDLGVLPLSVGDRYRWEVALFCEPTSNPAEFRVQGWIERRTPSEALAEQLAVTATEADRIALYASNGYWFNALDGLIQQKKAFPNDAEIQAAWADFLASVGLETLATQPIWGTVPEADVLEMDEAEPQP